MSGERRAVTTVEFWFDFASRYSYVAASYIETLERIGGAPIAWRRFLLGPIVRPAEALIVEARSEAAKAERAAGPSPPRPTQGRLVFGGIARRRASR